MACFVYTKIEVCKPLQKQQNNVCRYFTIGHAHLQQHTGLDIIVGSPMFTNKDLVFVNKPDPSVIAELYVLGFERYDLVVSFGKPLVNIYSCITH
jgi:hypothetical protein